MTTDASTFAELGTANSACLQQLPGRGWHLLSGGLHHNKMWTTFGGWPRLLCSRANSCSRGGAHTWNFPCLTNLCMCLGQVPTWHLPELSGS